MRRGMPPGAVELSYLEKKVLLALAKLEKAAPEEIRAAGKFRELVEALNAAIKAGGRIEAARLKSTCKFDDGELAVALGWLRRKGWAEVSKGPEGSFVIVTSAGRAAANSKGPDEILLARLAKGELTEDAIDPRLLRDLKSRRELVKERESVRREIALTAAGQKVHAAGIELKEEVAQPTTDLLQSGKWQTVDFRRYDTKAFAPLIRPGKRHVLGAYIERIRRIFLSMGFTEIEGDFVLPAFWNFDALFQPQDHPARDQLDTFYLEKPATRPLPDDGIVHRVAEAHETGGTTGSTGWRYRWNRTEAERAVLRSHTTPITLRWLGEHPDPPRKALGGSGIFRPEVTEPLGLKAPVLAWGLGLERLIMAVEGISDIRQLYLSDIDWLRDHRAVL